MFPYTGSVNSSLSTKILVQYLKRGLTRGRVWAEPSLLPEICPDPATWRLAYRPPEAPHTRNVCAHSVSCGVCYCVSLQICLRLNFGQVLSVLLQSSLYLLLRVLSRAVTCGNAGFCWSHRSWLSSSGIGLAVSTIWLLTSPDVGWRNRAGRPWLGVSEVHGIAYQWCRMNHTPWKRQNRAARFQRGGKLSKALRALLISQH